MENASKALIIAGAILLSILIISLGIMIFTQAKDSVGSNNLDKTKIAAFNSEWETYAGKNKSASEVRSMISAVNASNATEKKSGDGRYVKVIDGTVDSKTEYNETTLSKSVSNLTSSLAAAKSYKITATYDETSGLIKELKYEVQK